jgi:hypothetical protein
MRLSAVSSNKQLQRTVAGRRGRAACAAFHCAHAARWTVCHAAAELRRYAKQRRPLLPLLFLLGVVSVPYGSQAQGCEWENLPTPSSDAHVIEVLRSGGYGPPAGRTLVRVDASGQADWLPHGRCADRTVVGRLDSPSFENLEAEFRRAVEAMRSRPPGLFVSDEHPLSEILREGRREPLCQSIEDGEDVSITLFRDGMTEHYRCVTGPLLRLAGSILRLVPEAICAIRPNGACAERQLGLP